VNHAFQRGSLPAQLLGPRRIVPDTGLSQLQFYLGESFLAVVEVKGTP
jgi:hypothetical protein